MWCIHAPTNSSPAQPNLPCPPPFWKAGTTVSVRPSRWQEGFKIYHWSARHSIFKVPLLTKTYSPTYLTKQIKCVCLALKYNDITIVFTIFRLGHEDVLCHADRVCDFPYFEDVSQSPCSVGTPYWSKLSQTQFQNLLFVKSKIKFCSGQRQRNVPSTMATCSMFDFLWRWYYHKHSRDSRQILNNREFAMFRKDSRQILNFVAGLRHVLEVLPEGPSM